MLCKTMKPSSFPSLTHLLLLLLLLLCLLLNEGQGRDSSLHNETNEADLSEPHEDDEAAIWITLSQSGLDWLKDVIVEQILTKITPVTFPDITSDSTVPFVGRFMSYFSNFTLLRAAVGSSIVLVNEEGILLMASDVATNLSLDWQYTYDNMWLPSPISDSGGAFIQVVGMQSGVSVNVHKHSGTLQLNILQSGAYINDLDVQLSGESSWLYQWLVDGLKERIRVTTEEQLNEQIKLGVGNLNSFLFDIPQRVPVDETSVLNFSVVSEPIFNSSSISIGLKGEFLSLKKVKPTRNHVIQMLPPSLTCSDGAKMVSIALSESVLNDGAAVYYNMDLVNWLVDKMPDKTFLNTSKWRYIVPQLYIDYPNDEIKFRFEVTSPPTISLRSNGIEGSAVVDMIIEVINDDNIEQVACISITASLSGIAGLNGNNITGQINGLNDLNLELKWSNIGKVHLVLVKVFLKGILKEILLPYLNFSFRRGFPLPVIPYMELRDSNVEYGDGFLRVCTDVEYKGYANM